MISSFLSKIDFEIAIFFISFSQSYKEAVKTPFSDSLPPGYFKLSTLFNFCQELFFCLSPVKQGCRK